MKKWGTLILLLILVLAMFLRVYRLGDLLGFYYDQGRDALIIWNLIHHHQFFLIGPTTGIEGIFLGPFYYYLITPAYWLGRGSPVVTASFLALVNVLGIYWIYKIGKDFFSQTAGLVAAALMAFSINFIQAHRWLSNPTPLPLFAALAIWSVLHIINGNNKWWWLLGLCMGLGLQLEAASAIFFIPTVLVIFFVNRKNIIWSAKSLFSILITFGVTLLPQLFFNFRHQNILVNSFFRFLVSEQSFQPVVTNFLSERLKFFWESFAQLLMVDANWSKIFMTITVVLAILGFKTVKSRNFLAVLTWVMTPMVFLLFYHGNNGYVWGYYFTGVYGASVLLVATLWNKKFFLFFLFLIFAMQNVTRIGDLFNSKPYLSLGTSLAAVDWVYTDAGDKPFNQDVYVPPVIPYSFDYLFLWRGQTKYHVLPSVSSTPLLYTLYEEDSPHPERLEAWLNRQKNIGNVLDSQVFGGVTAQRRQRI